MFIGLKYQNVSVHELFSDFCLTGIGFRALQASGQSLIDFDRMIRLPIDASDHFSLLTGERTNRPSNNAFLPLYVTSLELLTPASSSAKIGVGDLPTKIDRNDRHLEIPTSVFAHFLADDLLSRHRRSGRHRIRSCWRLSWARCIRESLTLWEFH